MINYHRGADELYASRDTTEQRCAIDLKTINRFSDRCEDSGRSSAWVVHVEGDIQGANGLTGHTVLLYLVGRFSAPGL